MNEKDDPLANLDVDLSQESEMNQKIAADIATGKGIIAYGGANDNEVPEVLWNQYGHVPTGRIVVEARKDSVSVLGSAKSPVLHPGMADRVFGMDVVDQDVALGLSDRLWEKYRDVLQESGSKK